MAEKYTDYVVSATNQIHSILIETYEPDQKDLERVFAIGCHTLQRVSGQLEVLYDLRKMAITQEKYWAEYKEICENVHYFNEHFLHLERDALIKAGVSITARDLLLEHASALRKIIKDFRINPETIHANISELRDATCDIAKDVHNYPLKRKEKNQMIKWLKRLGAGIGGVALIGINASAIALSAGFSAPMMAVSSGTGGAFIGAAVTIKE
jgi:hypothetical protein